MLGTSTNITIDDPVEFLRTVCTASSDVIDSEVSIDTVAHTLQSRGTSLNLVKKLPKSSNGQNNNNNNNSKTNDDAPLNLTVSASNEKVSDCPIVVISNVSVPANRIYDLPVVLVDNSVTDVEPVQTNHSTQNNQNDQTSETALVSVNSNINNGLFSASTLESIINDVVDLSFQFNPNPVMPNISAPPVAAIVTFTCSGNNGNTQNYMTTTSMSQSNASYGSASNSQASNNYILTPNFTPSTSTDNRFTTMPQHSDQIYSMNSQNFGSVSQNYCYFSQTYGASSQDLSTFGSTIDQNNYINSVPNYIVTTQNYMPTFGSTVQSHISSNLSCFTGSFQDYMSTPSINSQFTLEFNKIMCPRLAPIINPTLI